MAAPKPNSYSRKKLPVSLTVPPCQTYSKTGIIKEKPMKKRRNRRKSRAKTQPVNRNHKDRLFRLAFQDRRDLLDLYNALNKTAYKDPEALTVTTLEDAVFLGLKNDISFIVGDALNLYEHQSTMCRNMPLRGLIYFSALYQTWVKENGYDLYGVRQIPLPFPNYVVFYNGNAEEPDETVLCLSEAFLLPDQNCTPAVECRVRMLNINQGHNRELMERCRRLWEYAEFIECIRNNLKDGMQIHGAVQCAMDTCERQGILSDLLARCRTEVLEMLLAEYDEQKTMEYIRREEREIGREEGEALLSELLNRLLADHRQEDVHLAISDRTARMRLYREYGLLEDV